MIIALSQQTKLETVRTEHGLIYLKREDLNHTGSHKDRAAARQLAEYAAQAVQAVVISSSGNAARATAAAAQKFGIPALVFMSPKTSITKVKAVVEFGGTPIISRKPINLAKYIARNYSVPNLRPSQCEFAVLGFSSLGDELLEHYFESGRSFDSVFTFASSAASFVAIGRQFLKNSGANGESPQLHAVQAGVGPLVLDPGEHGRRELAPKTGALGAKKTARAGEALEIIAKTEGHGWLVTDEEVDAAMELLEGQGIMICRESAASFAAAQRAQALGRVKNPCVVLTGARVSEVEIGATEHSHLELNDYLGAKNWADEVFATLEIAETQRSDIDEAGANPVIEKLEANH